MVNECLKTMTPEELKEHIQRCKAMLEYKENERWYELVGNLASAAQDLLNEYPNAVFQCEHYCEGCETRIDAKISVDQLSFEDNYVK